jgi:hypothetical protein
MLSTHCRNPSDNLFKMALWPGFGAVCIVSQMEDAEAIPSPAPDDDLSNDDESSFELGSSSSDDDADQNQPGADAVVVDERDDDGNRSEPEPVVVVDAVAIGSTAEFVNVISFCQTFAPILMLRPFSFLDLEQAIIFSRDDPLFADLAARCLYLGQNRKDALK